eukprot:COSAG05_NODE_10846_length_542_cov_1.616253_1_plen_77_part_00
MHGPQVRRAGPIGADGRERMPEGAVIPTQRQGPGPGWRGERAAIYADRQKRARVKCNFYRAISVVHACVDSCARVK